MSNLPADNPLRTPWKPDEPFPLPEYPRPQMIRSSWVNLNGAWKYAIRPKGDPFPQVYDGSILVPYPIESRLSGVQKPLLPDQRLWYRRWFDDPRRKFPPRRAVAEPKVLLHFGAVDYACEVRVNGIQVGAHVGGYLPFTFDITDALREEENELLVSVWDPTDTAMQQRGKQVLRPHGIWYTAVSGIWQTVWLEVVPAVSIQSLRLTPDLYSQSLAVVVQMRGEAQPENLRLEVEAYASGKLIATAVGPAGSPLALSIPEPRRWSPADPYLYDLEVRLVEADQVLDEVGGYFAMRQFGLAPDAAGHLRFTLNGEPLFLYGPLDQGYFPDGLYTPPSEETMLFDIEYARRLGCNLIRKHVKIEPLRWYYHCDRLGMIVWQDLPNGGKIDGDVVAFLSLIFGFHRNDTRRLGRFGRHDLEVCNEYRRDLQGMLDHLYNAACIAIWAPFNESWGQFQANMIAAWVKEYDPTRLVDHASGWFDQGGGDFQSKHVYFKKLGRGKPDARAFVISEFGGYGLKVPDHVWNPNKKFGYRHYASSDALTAAYLALLENELKSLIPQGLAAAVYTQLTDVEIEINGYLTYDRKVEKMDAPALRQAHRQLVDGNDLQG